LDEADARGELTAKMILADYHFAQGRTLLAGLTPSFAFSGLTSSFAESSERNTGSVPQPSPQPSVDAAMAAFDTALRIGEGGKETLNNLGSVCAEYGQLEAAERYYTQALEADPEYCTSLRNLGKVYVQTGRHGEALPLFERLLKQDPLAEYRDRLRITHFSAASIRPFGFATSFGGAEEAAQEVLQLDHKTAPATGASGAGLAANTVDGIGVFLHTKPFRPVHNDAGRGILLR
jgi:tetratricopeptide (TPR) repeat protein